MIRTLLLLFLLLPLSLHAQKTLYPLKVGQYYGCKDSQNHWVIPAEYKKLELVQGQDKPGAYRSYAVVETKNGKTGLLDDKNQWVIPALYNTIYVFSREDELPMPALYFCVKSADGKTGLYDAHNHLILETVFSEINLVNGYLFARTSSYDLKYQIYSLDGKLLSGEACWIIYSDYGFVLSRDKKHYLYDTHLKPVSVLDSNTNTGISEADAALKDSIIWRQWPVKRKYPQSRSLYHPYYEQLTYDGNKYGFLDYKGRELYTPQFRRVDRINKQYYALIGDSESIFIDSAGHVLFKGRFGNIEYMEDAKCLKVHAGGDYYFTLRRLDGSRILKDTLTDARYNYLSRIFIITYAYNNQTSKASMAVIDMKGRILIPPIYESIEESGENNYLVKKIDDTNEYGNNMGLTNKKGKVILPCCFSSIAYADKDRYWVATDTHCYYKYLHGKRRFNYESLTGLVNLKGKIIYISDTIGDPQLFNSGIAKISLFAPNIENQDAIPAYKRIRPYAYMDKNGKIKGNASFDNCSDFWHGTAYVIDNITTDREDGQSGQMVDIIDTKSTWFSNSRKALEANTKTVTQNIPNHDPQLRGENFLLYDIDDTTCVFITKEGGSPMKETIYQGYITLPFDRSRDDFSNTYFYPVVSYYYIDSIHKKQLRWPDEGMPNGFALLKDGKYALYDDEGRQCSGFIIDDIETIEETYIKLRIGDANGYIDKNYKILAWSEDNVPAIRPNKKKEWNHMKYVGLPPRLQRNLYYPYNYPPFPPVNYPPIHMPDGE